MQKILIIGSQGTLGQELVDIFQKDKKYKVIGWDKTDIDITREKEVQKKVLKLKPKIILNAAAYNAVDKCEKNKNEFRLAEKVNGLAPGYLAEVAKKINAIFVHYSSDYVFGKELPQVSEPTGCTGMCATCELHSDFNLDLGFDEKALPNPLNKYGKTKLKGEKEVQKKGKKYYIIRLSRLFGNSAISKKSKKSFFDIMLEMSKKNNEIKVVDEEISCFTYAPDLAQKTKEIIETKKEFGIYHIVNQGAVTWFEAAEELFLIAGSDKKIKAVDADEFFRLAKRPYISTLLNTKLEPLRNYQDALKEYLEKTGVLKN